MKHLSWLLVFFMMGAAFFSPVIASAQAEEPIVLFNGKNLDGWKAMRQNNAWKTAANVMVGTVDKTKFAIEAGEGILVNGDVGSTSNLYTEYEHGDCQLHIEFVVPHQSNSGVYFQGLYEIQVLDSYGKNDLYFGDCGGIYARFKNNQTYEGHPPRINATNPPGVWQSYDITFRAPRFDANGNKTENAKFIKVVLNGVTLHENVEVTGGTRSCMNRDEAPTGPLMLQGDHGPVAYRNIKLTPLKLK